MQGLAAICRGDGVIAIEKLLLASPAEGEVLVSLRLCGICGTDLYKIGSVPEAQGLVLGHELVGEVVVLGRGVETLAPGDRVAVPHHISCGECLFCLRGSETMCPRFRRLLLHPGGFSQVVRLERLAVAGTAWKIPAHVSDETAVFLEPAACVLRGIRRSGITRLDDGFPAVAVVLGGGSMGLLHLMVLRAVAPSVQVVLSEVKQERRDLALSYGAAAAVSPEELPAAVSAKSGGVGADVVFDTVGGRRGLDGGLRVLRSGGTFIVFAHGTAGERSGFELNELFRQEQRIVATYSGSLREQREVARLLESGSLDPSPLITHRLPLSRFAEAVDLARRQEALKIVITPEASS